MNILLLIMKRSLLDIENHYSIIKRVLNLQIYYLTYVRIIKHYSRKPMINLDDRYHSYLHGHKRMRIDGVDEKVKGYGWRDDGKDIIGYYVNTDNYRLQYTKDGNFLRMEALRELEKVA